MIEKADATNAPILTIGGRRFDFELFELRQWTEVSPLPGANDESALSAQAIAQWVSDSKLKTGFIVVIVGEEQIKAVMGMFRDALDHQEIAIRNLKNSMYALVEMIDVTMTAKLSDAIALDGKRVRFCFESTGQAAMTQSDEEHSP